MYINFINEGLTKEITCDKPSFDYNELSNLVSLDPLIRKKGFLVENFVKPPVLMKIEFICSITINKVTVNCQVGVQKSSLIEVYTKQKNVKERMLVARKELRQDENIINFVLHGSQQMNSGSGYGTFRLSKYMCNVNEVYLKILKTQDSTLVAIGKIDVWGKPSKTVDDNLVKRVNDIWTKINNCITDEKFDESAKSKVVKKSVFRYCREIKTPTIDIPEEYIDPITSEVLVIPMILPSGKVVDITTIERFSKEEEKLGRPPSDPFTGLLFTDSRHPIVASALKSRLDKFLLENSHIPSIMSVPRTVGRASYPLPSCSSHNPLYSKEQSSGSAEQNMNELVETCLTGLPSFLEKPTVKTLKIECFKCKSHSLLFKLSCGDLICRSCLVVYKRDNIKICPNCDNSLNYSTVERFHHV